MKQWYALYVSLYSYLIAVHNKSTRQQKFI